MSKEISREAIHRLINVDHNKPQKTIIYLLMSSGMKAMHIRRMTFNTVLTACDHFFTDGQEKTLENLILINPIRENLVPCFDFSTKSTARVVCCTPEAAQYLLWTISIRLHDDSRKNSDPIFITNRGTKIGENYISDLFANARRSIKLYSNSDFPNITAEDLQDRFFEICEHCLFGPRRNDVIKLMKGSRNKSVQAFYTEVLNDRTILTNEFLKISNILTDHDEYMHNLDFNQDYK